MAERSEAIFGSKAIVFDVQIFLIVDCNIAQMENKLASHDNELNCFNNVSNNNVKIGDWIYFNF
ncbi:hypothetical protein DERF_011282 [Dermatophagoides farinae]|uniref:Uncharacterized protein n=1 Tax=Dermatophagoides farinae TaxID=6954 RepID=A0A922L1H3_DERFA|nr:hypothetical protein DERF_011282 [Dermatophagoides farinae]